ncbi:hypothetical protein GCM10020000_73170 [Streptomyces olivoverticillatus]
MPGTAGRPCPLPRLLPLGGAGPEDVRYDAVTDRLLTGLADGRIVSVDPAGADVRTVAVTGGRPLGLCPLADGRILVCCADQGLLRVDPATGRKETVLREAGGKPLRVCSNAVAAPDGTLYVSDASRRFGLDHWMGDLLEHSGTGRLIRYEPGKPAEVVLDGLQFANGVALAPDASYVTVVETGAYRLRRLWLTGPKAGTDDVLLDNLPAFPDNLSTGPDGLIWVAMVAPRDPLADLLHRTHPGVRRALWALPPALMRGPPGPPPGSSAWTRPGGSSTICSGRAADGGPASAPPPATAWSPASASTGAASTWAAWWSRPSPWWTCRHRGRPEAPHHTFSPASTTMPATVQAT